MNKDKYVHLLLFVLALVGLYAAALLFDTTPRTITLEQTKQGVTK